MTAPSSVDRLRQAIAETLSIDAQGLQAAIGQLVVATSADYPAAGPEDRSLYSAAVRTTVLLADRIPAGQEAQALAQEIARHHGRQAAQAVLGERSAELLGGDGKVLNYTHQQLTRISELDAAIDAAADKGDDAFFAAVAAKDEYIDSQGIDRDRLEVTGREVIQAPKIPLALLSGITVIDAATTLAQARLWLDELEALYNKHFLKPEPTWTWEDVHECDRDAMIELEEVIRSSKNPPLDLDLVSKFRTPEWRTPYRKLSKQIGVSDLVFATQSANPQIEFAIGTHEGTAPGGKVQLRLLHVMRKWGSDGHGRPDGSMVQAIYAGVGNYSEFDAQHIRKIEPSDVPKLVVQSREQLLESLSSAAVQPAHQDLRVAVISFRAECDADIDRLLEALKSRIPGTYKVRERTPMLAPDVKVELEITRPLTVSALHQIMKSIPDGHVMAQTLRAVPLSGNSLERHMGPATITVEYSSVWDEDTLTTQAVLDLRTGEVTDIEPADSDEDLGRLQYEEIRDVSRGVSAVVEARDGRYFLKNMEMLSQFGGEPITGDQALERGGQAADHQSLMLSALRDVSHGLDVIEGALKVAASGDLAQAPFPLVGQEAQIHMQAQQGAYLHVLEMCSAESLKKWLAQERVAETGEEVLRAKLQEAAEGLEIIEQVLKKCTNGDLAQAPFPLTGQEAQIHLRAQSGAYRHALEMCNSGSVQQLLRGDKVAVTLGHTEKPLVCAPDDSPAPGM